MTCGGITPGINCVIKSLFTCLAQQYKVKKTIGVKMGMYGLMNPDKKYWEPLKAEDVNGIANIGGSILGTDRAKFDADKILDNLKLHGVTQLYVTGGEGTHKAL